jgi:hypothetical protein
LRRPPSAAKTAKPHGVSKRRSTNSRAAIKKKELLQRNQGQTISKLKKNSELLLFVKT